MANEIFFLEKIEDADFPPEWREALMEADLFPELAEAFRLQGKIAEAIKICRMGLHRRPDKLKGRLILGRCYLEKGLFQEAKEQLEKVMEEIEECLMVYKLLSQVYLQEKDVERALETLRKALLWPEIEGKTKKGLTPLEINIWQKKIEPLITSKKTEEKVNTSPSSVSQETFRTETMAQIYMKQGRKEKALDIYAELLARDPDNKAIKEKYASLAKSLEGEKRITQRQKVIKHLENWLATISLKRK